MPSSRGLLFAHIKIVCTKQSQFQNIILHVLMNYRYSSVRNNFIQLSGNFCAKIAIRIVNWVAICNNRVAIIRI